MSAEEEDAGSVADQAAAARMRIGCGSLPGIENANPSGTESQVSQVESLPARPSSGGPSVGEIPRNRQGRDTTTARRAGAGSDDGEGERPKAGESNCPAGPGPRSQQVIEARRAGCHEVPGGNAARGLIKHIREATKSSDMPAAFPSMSTL